MLPVFQAKDQRKKPEPEAPKPDEKVKRRIPAPKPIETPEEEKVTLRKHVFELVPQTETVRYIGTFVDI
jgi:hypothetical protein